MRQRLKILVAFFYAKKGEQDGGNKEKSEVIH